MRVTQRMWQRSMMDNINRSYQLMSSIDMRRRILKGSDDPAGTEQMVRLRALLSHNEQYQQNVASASRWLKYTEGALGTITECLRSSREIALTAADDSNALENLAEELDGIIQKMLMEANMEHGGRFIFAGGALGGKPFEISATGIIYHGDDRELSAAISSGLSLRYNVPGSEVFSPQEAFFEGSIDWDPVTDWDTEVPALFDGQGLDAGMIRIVDGAGTSVVVDLSGSATLGDIRDRIQAAQPGMTVSIVDGERLEIRDPAHPLESIRIEDVQGGTTARSLGVAGTGQGGVLISRDLDPCLDDSTPLAGLRGISLPLGSIGVRISDALEPTELDLSPAVTVGDLRALINGAFPELNVEIATGGNRLSITGSSQLRFEITSLDGDDTAEILGLLGSSVPNRPFGVLLELKEAIENGDRETVRALMPELEAVEKRILGIRARVGTRLNLAEDALSTLDSRNFAMTETISEIGDVDMAEALLMYQSAESVYQASLVLASNIYQLTLANYL